MFTSPWFWRNHRMPFNVFQRILTTVFPILVGWHTRSLFQETSVRYNIYYWFSEFGIRTCGLVSSSLARYTLLLPVLVPLHAGLGDVGEADARRCARGQVSFNVQRKITVKLA